MTRWTEIEPEGRRRSRRRSVRTPLGGPIPWTAQRLLIDWVGPWRSLGSGVAGPYLWTSWMGASDPVFTGPGAGEIPIPTEWSGVEFDVFVFTRAASGEVIDAVEMVVPATTESVFLRYVPSFPSAASPTATASLQMVSFGEPSTWPPYWMAWEPRPRSIATLSTVSRGHPLGSAFLAPVLLQVVVDGVDRSLSLRWDDRVGIAPGHRRLVFRAYVPELGSTTRAADVDLEPGDDLELVQSRLAFSRTKVTLVRDGERHPVELLPVR